MTRPGHIPFEGHKDTGVALVKAASHGRAAPPPAPFLLFLLHLLYLYLHLATAATFASSPASIRKRPMSLSTLPSILVLLWALRMEMDCGDWRRMKRKDIVVANSVAFESLGHEFPARRARMSEGEGLLLAKRMR